MPKITKSQAQALAKVIAKEIIASVAPANTAIYEAKETLIRSKLTGELLEMYDTVGNFSNKGAIEAFLQKKYADEFAALPANKNYNSWSLERDIEDDIIVQSIEAPNVAELIASIKAKYIE